MKSSNFHINSDGYIRINGKEWGDIIILKKSYLDEILSEVASSQNRSKSISDEIDTTTIDHVPDLLTEEFGDWVASIIRTYKITQTALANESKTTQASISRLISKDSKIIPQKNVREKVRKVLLDIERIKKISKLHF